VIASGKAADLRVDGEPQPWESFAQPLSVTRVGLAPGEHTLQIGGKKYEFVVGCTREEHDGPKDWPVYGFHQIKPDDKRCGHCHETSVADGRMSVGPLAGAKACLVCHKEAELVAKHAHPYKPIERCNSCHQLHGSTEKSLLKQPVKKLCGRCHEPRDP
jgi:predicted CXXCH cytochrome family protein